MASRYIFPRKIPADVESCAACGHVKPGLVKESREPGCWHCEVFDVAWQHCRPLATQKICMDIKERGGKCSW